jgi:RNA polymerase sigma factor (sigma-70 family)
MDPTNDPNQLGILMRAAQDGDSAAYLRLLQALLPRLRRVVRQRRQFLQPADVEDLVQDILLSLHAVRATYDPDRPFLPWLLTIAHNRMADGSRRQMRRAAKEVSVAEYPETFFDDPTNTGLSGYGDPAALRRAIGRLPDGQRKAIEMLKLREMSLKEAELASGMSISALKVAVHRGVHNLRKALSVEA